ncbi:hypothetical protein IPG41_02060 [Candidatus Peregrinibacteria bacterium]|nr:MAG: hypothetical protein IPG41_02060 [Candidatus Peregrinibacteria bacterium]
MVTETQLVLSFGTGFFLQVLRFLNWRPSYKNYDLIVTILIGVMAYLLTSLGIYLKEGEWLWDLNSFGMIFFTLLGILMYSFFKEKLIQPVTRQGVVTCFVVLCYWYLSHMDVSEVPFAVGLLFIFLLPLFFGEEVSYLDGGFIP